MWKPIKQCGVCRLILQGDKELKQRIFNSTYFMPMGGGETLVAIVESYGGTSKKAGVIGYQTLLNHVKRHQILDAPEQLRKSKEQLQTTTEQPLAPQLAIQPEEVYQEAMKQGMEKLQRGELQITARDLLKAATDKATIDLKKKDQEFKLAEMVYHFASGEATNATQYDRRIIEGQAATAYDAADITARNIEPGA